MGHYLACRLLRRGRHAALLHPVPAARLQPGRHARRVHPDPRPDPAPPRALRHRHRGPARRLRRLPARARARAFARRVLAPARRASPTASSLGEPLLFQWAVAISCCGGVAAEGQTLLIGPLGAGRVVRPVRDRAQPDADRPARRRPRDLRAASASALTVVSRVASWVCVALVYFGPSWLLWAVLLRVLGRRHPPTLDDAAPVGRARVVVGVARASRCSRCASRPTRS